MLILVDISNMYLVDISYIIFHVIFFTYSMLLHVVPAVIPQYSNLLVTLQLMNIFFQKLIPILTCDVGLPKTPAGKYLLQMGG